MTHNLADYHFPVHADVHDIDVIFVDERDDIVNPLGAKGLGEIRSGRCRRRHRERGLTTPPASEFVTSRSRSTSSCDNRPGYLVATIQILLPGAFRLQL